MLKPFFVVAMQSRGRQATFRRVVVIHCLLCGVLAFVASRAETATTLTNVGYALLCQGIVEGAALIGWRLTQLPKSQALEFLLTSPIQPKRLFLAEAFVGSSRFALVQLAGLPIVGGLLFSGVVDPQDLLVLWVMPFAWGLLAGLLLTSWVYEPQLVKRLGQLVALVGVLIYLVIGVMAAENLILWLHELPEWLGAFIYHSVRFFHDLNPFGIVRYWFANDRVDWIARERFAGLHAFALFLIFFATTRAAFRLRGHFHERHYKPIDSSRPSQLELIGDAPLSWWAVRRVMEYSGSINLWLAGGFCLIYATYIIAGEDWPPWMGRMVFQLLENWGGAPAIAAALAVMATVPAVFQFGLWDATRQDRCRRLELLLLTELDEGDYWKASLAASWRRGRGYLLAAAFLWFALGVSGRNSWPEVLASACAGCLLWGLSFAVGFRAFSTGAQTSGMSSFLVLGVPMILVGLLKLGYEAEANFLPVGLVYMPLKSGLTLPWFAAYALTTFGAVALSRFGLARCDSGLRRWYSENQGAIAAE